VGSAFMGNWPRKIVCRYLVIERCEMWKYVTARFNGLMSNLALTPEQIEDGRTKHEGVRTALNSHYYGQGSGSANSFLVGSWGKSTRIRPPRDVDILFRLPDSMYWRFAQRTGNVQSQILQEVRGVLERTYSTTRIKGDGPVVRVPFNSYAVEVLPVFLFTDGYYRICEAKNGGSYKKCDPVAESKAISDSDAAFNSNTRDLIRMMKCWQAYCKVPIKSFHIELLVPEFLNEWYFRGSSRYYYDWIVRDFFEFIQRKASGLLFVPGTYEVVQLGDGWKSRAESAHTRSIYACEYEKADLAIHAGEEWQKISGTDMPLNP
jgi:hypothetical protein